MQDLTVVIISCDNYSDLWGPFFQLYKKYFPQVLKTYILTETKDCPYAETIKVNYPRELGTKRVRESLKQIDSKYILLLSDDFFLMNDVELDRIQEVLDMFEDEDVFYSFEQSWSKLDVDCNKKGFKKRNNSDAYVYNLQAGIWNREKLISIYNVDTDFWTFETSKLTLTGNFYNNTGTPIIDYGKIPFGIFGIFRGKWTHHAEELFKKEGIEIDFSSRGFYG